MPTGRLPGRSRVIAGVFVLDKTAAVAAGDFGKRKDKTGQQRLKVSSCLVAVGPGMKRSAGVGREAAADAGAVALDEFVDCR